MTPVADSIVTLLQLNPRVGLTTLTAIEVHRGFTRDEVLDALANLSLVGRVAVDLRDDGTWLSLIAKPWDEDQIPPASFAAADHFRQLHHPTWRDRVMVRLANAWAWIANAFDRIRDRIVGGLALLIITTFFTIGLCAADGVGSGRWIMAEVTAYCPCTLCCGTHDRTTANNTNTDRVPYAFAADRSLPFDARVYVPAGLGVLDRVRADDRWFTVDDRGGALDTEARRYGVLRLDLRVREHGWAVRFGRRSLPVYVTTNH